MLLLPFLHACHFSVSSGNERFCAFVCWAGASGGSHDHSRGSAVHDIYVWQSPGSPGARCFGLCLIHQWFICHNMVRRMGFVLAVCVSRVITWWSILPCWWILLSLMLGLQMLGFLLVLTHFTGPLSAAALISFSCKRQIMWELLYFYNCTETERKEHKPGWFTCICSFSVARIHGFLLCRMFWCPLGAELVSVINSVPDTEWRRKRGFFLMKILYDSAQFLISQSYMAEKIPTLRWGVEASQCFPLNEKWLFMAINKGLNRAW